MCRLFALRSESPRDARDALLDSSQSLRALAREHPDGWGIATFGADGPRIERGLGAAHEDAAFARAADVGPTGLLLAHIRQASVGAVKMENVHPFVRGRWVFMHNGTLTDFASHRAAIEARIHPALLPSITSTTDSERCFLLFLTFLQERRGGVEGAALEEIGWALASVMDFVARHTDRPGLERSSMNLLVSDGAQICITRRGRTLVLSTGESVGELPSHGARLSSFALASEPPGTGTGWLEVPEESVIGVDSNLRFSRWTVQELSAAVTPTRVFG